MIKGRLLGVAALLALPFGVASSRASTPSLIVFAADRAPSVTGEIYRLDPNGHRVDLSKSPYQDTNPAVSSDGKHVAFISDRGGGAVYEVGINGRGLVRVGPSITPRAQAECDPQLLWQPGGSVLAVSTCGPARASLWIVRRGRKPLKLVERKNGVTNASWSPDGRVLLASPFPGTYRAFDPAGRRLWTAYGSCCASWSAQDLLAVSVESHFGFRVYDESGHLDFKSGGMVNSNLAWSSDGRLAALLGKKLEVWSQGGTLTFTKAISGESGVVWEDSRHVIVGAFGCSQCHAKSVDVQTGQIRPASENWFDALSPDRKLAIVTARSGSAFALGVAPPSGGRKRVYGHIGGCLAYGYLTPALSWPQFAGRSRSIVYQSWGECDEPFSNLYSAPPSGGQEQQLTNVQAQETQPAISPDGSQIAYVWAKATGISCSGCSDGIRIAGADGSAIRTVTDPQDCTFDDSPSWSPDASTILFAETGCDSPSELYTIPAIGGAQHDLGIAGNAPVWGPSRIAYVLGDQADGGIWTAKPDGTDRVEVAAGGRSPAWSTDGRLAYLVGAKQTTVVVGATSTKLPFASVASLAWSPDGTQFVVIARAKNAVANDVYTVKTDGTDPVRLTTNYGALGASW